MKNARRRPRRRESHGASFGDGEARRTTRTHRAFAFFFGPICQYSIESYCLSPIWANRDSYRAIWPWSFFEKGAGTVADRKGLFRRIAEDEYGAVIIEYSVLLGVLIVAILATVIAVGQWVNGIWSDLNGQLS